MFFDGFRGHYDLAFIFSSVNFRVLPWLKLLLLIDTLPPKVTHYRFYLQILFFRVLRWLPWPYETA